MMPVDATIQVIACCLLKPLSRPTITYPKYLFWPWPHLWPLLWSSLVWIPRPYSHRPLRLHVFVSCPDWVTWSPLQGHKSSPHFRKKEIKVDIWTLIQYKEDRLISTIGFPILVRLHLYIESGPCSAKFILAKSVCIFNLFSSLRKHSWLKTRSHLSYIYNTMAADDLATHGARASAIVILT